MTSTSCSRSTTSLTMRTTLAACGHVSDTRRRVGLAGREQCVMHAAFGLDVFQAIPLYGSQVPAQQFGLSTEDILLRSDRELNQVGGPLLRPASRVCGDIHAGLPHQPQGQPYHGYLVRRPSPSILAKALTPCAHPLCPCLWSYRWSASGGWPPTRRTRRASDPTTRH